MHFFSLIGIAAFAGSALAAPHSSYVVHERREASPRQWSKERILHPDHTLPVRIGLTQNNLDKGHDILMEVSSHDSPKYGEYLTQDEIHDLFAPSETAVDAVRGWLESAGVAKHRVSQSVNKQWIQFDAAVSEMENLLQTKYHLWRHSGTGRTNIACDEYSVPAEVQEHIDYITPGLKLHAVGRGGRHTSKIEKRTFGVTGNGPITPPLLADLTIPLAELIASVGSPATCDAAITPDCIKTLYNITAPTKHRAGNQLGIFEDLNDKYSQTDLDEFFQAFASNIPTGTHPTLRAVDGATAPTDVADAGPESDLDFQISYPIIYPQGEVLYQTDDNVYEANYTYEGFLNNFLDAIDGSYCSYSAFGETGNSPLDPPYPDPQAGGYKGKLQCGKYKPTNVISISYGGQEYDLPASYQKRQCNEYMKLGMQGISIVLASGDSGVAGPAGDDSSNGCLGPDSTIFSPDFPATCPYLSTVGATYLPPGGDATMDQEVAVSRFGSGGGFSNIYAIPWYQASAVASFFKNHNPPYKYYSSTNNNSFGANGGIYNRKGRGYPDFSAVGDNVVIFNAGAPTLIGGTSASAPVFASILTRINEERLAVGKSTIGFVNPTLYAHPKVFHDITSGDNPGCGTNGFNATTGWDPVTGLGTPNYPALLKLFLSLK